MTTAVRKVLLAAALALGACRAAPAPPNGQFQVSLRTMSDDGERLSGARFRMGSKELGTTTATGELHVSISGSEGQVIRLALECPDGFVPAAPPAPVRLTQTRRVGSSAYHAIVVDTVCARAVREVVVVVHAGRGNGLPIQIDGQPAATTDADGNAHVLLRVQRGPRKLRIALDTSKRKELKPISPGREFELAGSDALVIYAQEFVAKKVPTRHHASQRVTRHVPYRVD